MAEQKNTTGAAAAAAAAAGVAAFILEALGKILSDLQFGPYERKVKKYLDEATTDSVLEDLKKLLTPKLRVVKSLGTTFDAYCVEASSQQRYWNINSFSKFIESRQPDVALSEAAVQLLRRCFHFYAYHPFPRDSTDGNIDSASFQRAVALLVVQGTDFLGTQEGGDYFWRNDDAFFRKSNFERIFRSIGLPENSDRVSNHLDHGSIPSLEDTMDVLAMTQPQTISLAPSPYQLGPAARKLLSEGVFQERCRVARKDLSRLLSLLLRLRLRDAKWGTLFHFGTLEERDPADEELADILVRGLGGDQDEDYLTSSLNIMATNLLPDLQLRFHQLWAVLFQPPMTADDRAPSQIRTAVPNHILAATSFFIPQTKISNRYQPTTQDMRISLGNSYSSSQKSYDLTVTRLIQSLTEEAYPHLILLTSNGTVTTPLTILGAYFPSRLSKPSTSQFLFQLRPQFRIYRWNGPQITLANIINIEDDTRSTKPYRIGDPERNGVSLRIDPEMKSATLRSNTTNAYSGESVGYKLVCMNGSDSDINIYSNWEVSVKIDHFDTFRVKSGVDTNFDSEGVKDLHRYTQDATIGKIKGEELSRRIQGFGPTSH